MNQEIEGNLKEILERVEQNSAYGLCSVEEAIKAIQELVVSTVPETRTLYNNDGYSECRSEILKKWGKA